VLIPGTVGSSAIFYKIMRPLAAKYHLVLIDLIGMGASSRPKFTCKTSEEAGEYFINSLE
jgi:abhydrolase domain-containing protein 5